MEKPYGPIVPCCSFSLYFIPFHTAYLDYSFFVSDTKAVHFHSIILNTWEQFETAVFLPL